MGKTAKTNIIARLLLCLTLFILLPACGKKGPPTMDSFARPAIVKDVGLVHRDGRIDISWTYSKQNPKIIIQGFRIERAEGNALYETVASLPADAVYYSDAGITINKVYRYRILVLNARGVVSDPSEDLKVMPVTPPPPPDGLVQRITTGAVEISWNKAAEGVTFNIYRSEIKGIYPAASLNDKPLTRPFFKDNLNALKPVYYSVVAVIKSDIPNESAMSAELMVDPGTFVPAAPADIRYVRSDNRGYISWKESDEPWVRGYRVYRRGASGDFGLISEVNVPIYLDEDPFDEKNAYYVTAVGPGKESPPSDTVQAKP
jgi:hypothetical protein